MDFDKTPSNDTDNGSDDDDYTKKKQRSSVDDDLDFDNDDLDETGLRNIWTKRRKLTDHRQTSSSNIQTEVTKNEPNNSNSNQTKVNNEYKNVDKHPPTNCLYMRPHDHQVPTIIPVQHDDVMVMSNTLVIQIFNF
jgi:hypothetical protein